MVFNNFSCRQACICCQRSDLFPFAHTRSHHWSSDRISHRSLGARRGNKSTHVIKFLHWNIYYYLNHLWWLSRWGFFRTKKKWEYKINEKKKCWIILRPYKFIVSVYNQICIMYKSFTIHTFFEYNRRAFYHFISRAFKIRMQLPSVQMVQLYM